ncbi:MAG: hypothetical protein ACI9HK_002638 [Pirellulaceae bacterium]|jgi:hypothetical protein
MSIVTIAAALAYSVVATITNALRHVSKLIRENQDSMKRVPVPVRSPIRMEELPRDS